MALILSQAERARFEADLAAAKPYESEEDIALDGEVDTARWKATMAQKFLRMADEETSN